MRTFKGILTTLLTLGIIASNNAESELTWKKKTTCGKVNYKTGLYKTWKVDDSTKPLNIGQCKQKCKLAGQGKCKGFVFYYKKKNCLLLNYETDQNNFIKHVSAACGYWIDVPTKPDKPALPTITPTQSPTKNPTPEPTISPAPTNLQCKVRILLKFARNPDEIPTFGTHNDYLVVTKQSNQENFESCCYNQQEQPYCKHDGGDAVFENFADEYYDHIESEEVFIPNARGQSFLLESKHYFNDFEAAYYGAGYADHTYPAKMIVYVNGKYIKKLSHPKNKGRNTHLNLKSFADRQINPKYLGYVKAKLKCDMNCECKVIVWRRTQRPKDGPCDNFEEDKVENVLRPIHNPKI